MRCSLLLTSFCLSLSLLPSTSGVDEPPKKQDDPYKALEGTWQVTRWEIAGKNRDKDDGSFGQFQFGREVVKMSTDKEEVEFKHELRPKSKPAEINFFANSMYSKLILRGVYRLDGDELTICVAPAKQDRPTEFKTRKDDGTILFVMKRKK